MKGQKIIHSSQSDEWCTPEHIIHYIENKGHHIVLDLAATEHNRVCAHYVKDIFAFNIAILFAPLSKISNISTEIAFCNPPYSQWQKFVKVIARSNVPTIMLLPARTDTKAFHEFIYNKSNVKIEFIKGRLKFSDSKNSAPFPSMLVYFKC